MRLFIIGSGVVGKATGIGLISKGHEATFYDVDPSRLKGLEHQGYETTQEISGLVDADFVAVCVPTPAKDHNLDTTFVRDAVSSAAPFIRDQVIMVRSTLVPGTMRGLASIVPAQNLTHNPEFLREASSLEDFLRPDRVVIGSESKSAALKVKELYSWFNGPVVRTNWETAEMIKLVSNAFLCTKISFFNEVYLMCKKLGLDPEVVSEAVALDERIGKYGTLGGRPFDGKCLPKDIGALVGFTVTNPSVIVAAQQFNDRHMR